MVMFVFFIQVDLGKEKIGLNRIIIYSYLGTRHDFAQHCTNMYIKRWLCNCSSAIRKYDSNRILFTCSPHCSEVSSLSRLLLLLCERLRRKWSVDNKWWGFLISVQSLMYWCGIKWLTAHCPDSRDYRASGNIGECEI